MLEILAVTMYAGQYVGQSTFCGAMYGDGIALPIETHGTEWECGNLIAIWTEDRNGQERFTFARALDAGPFGNHCVMQPDGFCASIVADVPINLWPHGSDTSARVTYWQNITAKAREAGAW